MAGLMNRMNTVFKAKVSKMLDRAEDPNETLDYSYQKQLEMLQKVKQGIATVVTSKKRLQLQTAKLEASVGHAREPGAHRARRRPRGPGPHGARAQGAGAVPAAGPGHPDRRARGRAAAADRERAPAERQGRDLPHAQGGHQGAVHRRRGDRPDRRGPDRPVRGDGRRRAGDPARRGQDRADAGPRRRPSASSSTRGVLEDALSPGQSDLDRADRPADGVLRRRLRSREDEARARHGQRRRGGAAGRRASPRRRRGDAAPKEAQP